LSIKKDGLYQNQTVVRGDQRLYVIDYPTPIEGDHVTVQLYNHQNALQLAEVEVFTDVVGHQGEMTVNEYIYSLNKRYGFVYQYDNNLVFKDLSTGQTLWSSNTFSTTPGKATLERNGTLSVTSGDGQKKWSHSNPATVYQGTRGAYMIVTDDGFVNIYDGDGSDKIRWSIDKNGNIRNY